MGQLAELVGSVPGRVVHAEGNCTYHTHKHTDRQKDEYTRSNKGWALESKRAISSEAPLPETEGMKRKHSIAVFTVRGPSL